MISWKGAALLGAVLVGLAVYLYATRPVSRPAPAPASLLPCAAGQVVELKVAGGGKMTDAVRSSPGDPWRLAAPAGRPADGPAIDNLAATAAALTPVTTLKASLSDAAAGLAPPSLTVGCNLAGGRSYTLSVGGQTFDGSGYYARAAGSGLYVIPSATVDTFRSALDSPPVASPSPSGGPSPSPSA